ncbi:MAG: hypothetical protein ACM3X3_06810 [Betaproteobacteria bacterium]
MSVRSVDVQNAVARATEAERVQRVQNEAGATGQQAFAAELSKRAEERSTQVTSSPKAEDEVIRDEKERRRKGSGEAGSGQARARGGRGAGGGAPDGASGAGAAETPAAGSGPAGTVGESPLPGRIIDVEV